MSDYKYRITADSGCDLSLELCESLGVLPYKMPFTMDGELMTDGMTEESFRRFYDMMRAGGVAKTSQINPGEFIDFWRPLAEAGEDVLHVSLASAISGSCDNARSAAETLEFFRKEGVDVKIISGDHITTVSMIAKRAGLRRWRDAVDLSVQEEHPDYDMLCRKYSVFAMVTPG